MNKLRRAILASSIGLLALAIGGCGNAFLLASKGNASAGNATLRLSATIEYAGSASRTVTPGGDPDVSSYELLGALVGQAQTSLGTWASLSDASLALASGSWDFTLVAKNSSGDAFLSGSRTGVLLSDSPVSLSFTLAPLSSGTGNATVTVSWPSTISVASAVPVFNGSAGAALPQSSAASTTSVTYATATATGKYLLTFALKDASGDLLASVSELVRVYPNMTSAKTIALSASDFNSAPAAPSGVSVAHVADSSSTGTVRVSWTDSSYNETGFEVYDGTKTWATTAASVNSATISGLARGSSYSFQVRAINGFGSSAYINAVSAYVVPSSLYTITFNANGGSGTMSVQTIESGTSFAITPNAYTNNGYCFNGWATNASATRAIYADGASYLMNNTGETLYAVWSSLISNFNSTTSGGVVTITKYTGSTASVVIPSIIGGCPVTAIGSNAFEFKSSLASVVIPASVTNIGNYAFCYCTNLLTVIIPSTVTKIGAGAFAESTKLSTITVDPDNDFYASVNGVLFNKVLTNLISYPAGKTDISYTIPDSVTNIGEYAFNGCMNLKSINIPTSVTAFESWAFADCMGVTSLEIPSSVNNIGRAVFISCINLKTISIPSSVTSVGLNAFYGCSSLLSVTIPSSVTSIFDEAFANCDSLSSIYINSSKPPLLNNSNAFEGRMSDCKFFVPSSSVNAYRTAPNWSSYATYIVSQ